MCFCVDAARSMGTKPVGRGEPVASPTATFPSPVSGKQGSLVADWWWMCLWVHVRVPSPYTPFHTFLPGWLILPGRHNIHKLSCCKHQHLFVLSVITDHLKCFPLLDNDSNETSLLFSTLWSVCRCWCCAFKQKQVWPKPLCWKSGWLKQGKM